MVIKSKIRGNGRQLASYLLAKSQNEKVRLLEVDGMEQFNEQDFRNLLGDMSLNERLTRSRQGIYHAIVNPSIDDARTMTDQEWVLAGDILAEEIGFSNQRRAIVLHEKRGRVHAHIAFERYDHDRAVMIPIDHNYRKQDKARARMETVFYHQPTDRRNPRRVPMKQALTKLWQETADAAAFMSEAKKQGYMISKGFDRIPYMVVDDTGRSFNLIRHLDGIKTKEVRDRLGAKVLISEKDAIAFVRTQDEVTHNTKNSPVISYEQPQEKPVNTFAENLAALRQRQQERKHKPRMG